MALITRAKPLRFLDRVLHRQRVHHRGQHAHVVAGDAIHAGRGKAGAAEDVAAADDYTDLHAGALDLDDLVGQSADDLGVDAVVGLAHQCFTGELEQDAAVLQRLVAHGISGLCVAKQLHCTGCWKWLGERLPRCDLFVSTIRYTDVKKPRFPAAFLMLAE
jgi:hypothetical protein